ncbi:SDS3 (YIL084C) [Zygosaccharomyces parabailii]|nr:SDS3 (YIL084C) [Zygosaccharomyces parabailii]
MNQKQSAQELSRKDKRRHNIESKVGKIYHTFVLDKDFHYKERLTALQTDLTTLHQGNNRSYLRALRDYEEARDLELVRLRLFEEYRVSRSGVEFQEDIEKAKQEHEKLVKLCKEKLYESIQHNIKMLQEDRLLMDVANAHSYAIDYYRGKYQKHTRSHTASGWESSSNELGGRGDSPNESATDTATERRSLRRRAATKGASGASRLASHAEESDFQANSSAQGHVGGTRPVAALKGQDARLDVSSDSEFLQDISDHAELYALLFGEKGADSRTTDRRKHRTSQRYTAKSAPPLPSLNPEEVTDDIAVIRQLTNQPPAPFKQRTSE